jgi:DNA-binding transcriptional MerR regulator
VKKPLSKKPRYNLNLVIQETGIKADTLRAWERRYHLPQPERSEGGQRLFSEYDIETLRWLLSRQEEGMRIGQAVKLWREIETQGQDPIGEPKTDQISTQEKKSLITIRDNWIQACLDFDEFTAEQILNQSFVQFAFETVCFEILQSGLAQIGSLWHQGQASVQQEHFASELAVRRLQSLILAAPQPIREETILVGCPPDENHTFSVLLLTLLLRYRSWNVTYLGANIPKQQLKSTIEKAQPNLVVMSSMRLVTSASLFDIAMFLNELSIPFAFGGRIFNLLPDLPNRIPGYFLGKGISEAIRIIENLLTAPMPMVDLPPNPDEFTETIRHFKEKQPAIEIQTLNSLREKLGENIYLQDIENANHYLAQDILAALTLGDLSFLGSNIEWVDGLITNHHIPGELLSQYLSGYLDAAKSNLNESGLPIIDWLTLINQNN